MKKWGQTISMVSRGANYQIKLAAALMAVIPIMVVCFFALISFFPAGTYGLGAKAAIGAFAFVIAFIGYGILRKYPENIVKLRHYLQEIAAGELPESIMLMNSADDIKAIEDYLNTVLAELKRKVKMLEFQLTLTHSLKNAMAAQQNELIEAERHRVMIHSLGAACHHLGQPVTILRTNLYLLADKMTAPEDQAIVRECETAIDAITTILDKLRHVSDYRTVPYRTFHMPFGQLDDGTRCMDTEILDIDRPA